LETLEAARDVLTKAGWEVELVQLQVSRSHPLAGGTALQALNPVWVITGFLRGGPGKDNSPALPSNSFPSAL
jgi:precorrin-6Y C5,15-methyltransferase (decarboxylating)